MSQTALIRLGCFLGILALLALCELYGPRREHTTSKRRRWFSNLTITVLNPFLVRLLIPLLPVAFAAMAETRGWGLLNNLALPSWVGVIIGFLALDLVIYLQHILFHAVPAMWRFHMMHHADLDFDVTTGLRFHPGEILISTGIKLGVVAAAGVPPLAALLFAIALNAASMFNHSNIRIPPKVDRILRLLLITPDMHRVHHSVIIRETNSNFGFTVPWWDRLLGTYKDQPRMGHEKMTIGLAQFRDPSELSLPKLLVLPIVGDPGRQPINRH